MSYKIVSRVIGVLLLVAAGLKLHGLAVEPVGHVGVFAAPEWQFGIVEVEILLGLWLLSGHKPVWAWLFALLMFSAFAAINSYQGWVGYASCGCFGALEVNPWLTFVIDIATVVGLALARPTPPLLPTQPPVSYSSKLWTLASGAPGIVAVLGTMAGVAHLSSGSIPAALAYLRAETLSISPQLLYVGEGRPGEMSVQSVEIRNWGEGEVLLYGGTSDCSCIVTDDLPLTIPPRGADVIRVRVRLPAAEGIFYRSASLRTSDPGMPALHLRITGRISRPVEHKHSEIK